MSWAVFLHGKWRCAVGRQKVQKSRVQHTRIWVAMATEATRTVASRAECKARCSSELTRSEDTTMQRLRGARAACSLPRPGSGGSGREARRA